jgi:hypothetical protein
MVEPPGYALPQSNGMAHHAASRTTEYNNNLQQKSTVNNLHGSFQDPHPNQPEISLGLPWRNTGVMTICPCITYMRSPIRTLHRTITIVCLHHTIRNIVYRHTIDNMLLCMLTCRQMCTCMVGCNQHAKRVLSAPGLRVKHSQVLWRQQRVPLAGWQA